MWLASASKSAKERAVRLAAFVLALALALAAMLSGMAGGIEKYVRDGRDSLRISPASGEIVVLEIDGRSLQALDTWPWPRSYHANALKELDRLGAAQVAFDVDFSANSSPAEDAALEEAMADFDGSIILPTFRQVNQATDDLEITEALPLPQFRKDVFLASVNVFPDADGVVMEYPHGVSTNGVPRPSLATMIADHSGRIDQSFQIDQAIDPDTIDRISFVELLEGNVERERVEGKRILVGATAIEMGDRYPTTLFGMQPGVIVHAKAAETLLLDRVRQNASAWLPFLVCAALLLGAVFLPMVPAAAAFAITFIVSGFAVGLDRIAGPYFELAPSLILLISFMGIHRLLYSTLGLREAKLLDERTGLPNRTAMGIDTAKLNSPVFAAVRIDDFDQLEAIASVTTLTALEKKVGERLSLLAGSRPVYRIERGFFAWVVPLDQNTQLDEHFASARTLFNASFEADGEKMRLSASFGSSDETIGNAVSAAEHARRRGLHWSTAATEMQKASQFQQTVLTELGEALETGAIRVVFQPKLRISDGVVSGAECLVRWNSRALGAISPADFIPVLEEKGEIHKLTMFVLHTAIVRAREARKDGYALRLAVNISAQLLSDPVFVDETVAVLEDAKDLGPQAVTLEITESAPLHDADLAKLALERFHAAGARISIDDYGTGQATLNYLQGFPAQEIKLDQSFVRSLVSNRADRIMVQSTIDLAHALSFEIVAEGIEDETTLSVLGEFGCDYGQGWEIGKPMDWPDFVASLRKGEPSMTSAA